MKPFFVSALLFGVLTGCAAPKDTVKEEAIDTLIAYPDYSGTYDGFTLKIDERFNTLNPALWKTGDGAVGAEAKCRFHPDGVQLADGVLQLVVKPMSVPPSWSDDHQQEKKAYDYVCGELRTVPERTFRYGRIEARMKAPPRATASGYISSLFTYTNPLDPKDPNPVDSEWEEIDIELEGGRPDKFQANLIYGMNTWEWWRTRDWGAWEDKIIVGPVDEWRVFAIEWVPDAIRWYVDGELIKTLSAGDLDCDPECVAPQKFPTPIPDNPTAILMNFWIPNDIIENDFGGNKSRNIYPLYAEYDWFRYYELDTHPSTANK